MTSSTVIEGSKEAIVADTSGEGARVEAVYITLQTSTIDIKVSSITNTAKSVPIAIYTTILDTNLSYKNISTLTDTARTIPSRKLWASLANPVYDVLPLGIAYTLLSISI